MKILGRWVLVMAVLGAVQVGHAYTGAWELSLAPGYAIPVGPASDYLKGSASIDGSALYNFNDWLSSGLELGYIFGSKFEGVAPGRDVGDIDGDGVNDPISFTSDMHASVLHVTPEIKIGPTLKRGDMTIKPYGIVGGGFYWSHLSAGTLTLTGRTSGGIDLNGLNAAEDSIDDKNGGFNVGGGLDIGVTPNFRLGADVRYHRIFYSEGDDTEYVIPALRLTLLF
jgi:opacity protein-like surface antigen